MSTYQKFLDGAYTNSAPYPSKPVEPESRSPERCGYGTRRAQ